MGFFLSLIGAALLLVGGGGCALLLLPRRQPAQLVEVFALSVALGSLLVALISFVFGFLVSGFTLRLAVGLACLGVAGLGGRFGAPIRVGRPSPGCWALPMVVFVAELSFLVWLGGRWTLGWDSLVNWEFKARVATLNGGGMPLAYYLDVGTQWSHPEYPLLLPLTEAWLFDWAGRADERLVRGLFGLYDAALLAGLYVLGTRFGTSRWNGTLGMFLVVLVPQLIVGIGSTTTAWADYLIALLYLMAGGYLVQAVARATPELFRLVTVLSVALVWTKQEGAFLWLSLALATALFARGHRVRGTTLVVLPALVMLAGWRLFIQALGVPPSFDFLPVTVSTFLGHLDRVPELVGWTANKMTDGGAWGLLWAGLVLAVLLPDRRQVRQQLTLGLLVLTPLVPDMLSFVFSAWTPYTSHVENAMPRLMEQLAPLGVLAVASAAPCPPVPRPLRCLNTLLHGFGPVQPGHRTK
ncbi:MAG: hypothetical protein M3069_29035 [Chloroflexota bacterium]|nr:hypothetical protein [Chloroflexota bacterium]